MKEKITKEFLKEIKYPEGKKQLFIYDTKLAGFGVRVSSQSIAFIIQAVLPGKKKQSRITIGKFGQITVEEARKEAKKLFYEISQGINPKAEKEAEQERAVTLGDVVNSYIEARGKNLKASTLHEINRHLTRNFTDWQDKPVVRITREKVKNRFLEISSRAPVQANQAFRHLKSWLNYAAANYRPNDEPLFIENPVLVLNHTRLWNREKTRNGRIPVEQVGNVWKFLKTLREAPATAEISKTHIDAVLLLILTGNRWEEVASLRWSQINTMNKFYTLPDPKNRQEVKIPLSSLAYEILLNRPRYSDFVFHSDSTKTDYISEVRTVMKKISDIAGLEKKLTAHDMRRTFTSIGIAAGVEGWKIKLLKNTISNDVHEKHYVETSDLTYLKPDAEKIAQWILIQVDNTRRAKVIQLFGNQ
ncbi:MAG: tyrosine-type recombinase/integrase [Desulfobacteraceae bacterium]